MPVHQLGIDEPAGEYMVICGFDCHEYCGLITIASLGELMSAMTWLTVVSAPLACVVVEVVLVVVADCKVDVAAALDAPEDGAAGDDAPSAFDATSALLICVFKGSVPPVVEVPPPPPPHATSVNDIKMLDG